MKVPVSFRTLHAMADKTILVDSGATDNFIHPKLLKWLGLGSHPLERPWKIWNIDGTTNKAGALTHCVDLEVRTGNRQEIMKFLVTDLGREDLILGYPWLSTFEPKFRWRDASIDTSFLPIVTDAHILSYFSVFYTDLFDEVLVFESLSLNMIRWLVTCCHHVHSKSHEVSCEVMWPWEGLAMFR